MRKINKSALPNLLSNYAIKHPDDYWDDFKQYNASSDFNQIKKKLFTEQNDICAYCEVNLDVDEDDGRYEHHRRVEHFDSKSSWRRGDPYPNLHLLWNNLFGVCLGGTDPKNMAQYEMPANKSCDSFKEHLETNVAGTSKIWTGNVLKPSNSKISSNLFSYDKATGHLIVNSDFCNSVVITPNLHATVAELVENTIISFNLNCERLNGARRMVHHEFERQKKHARSNIEKYKKFVLNWSTGKPKPFQTTRDILIRDCSIAQKLLQGQMLQRKGN
ncbi:TIGR02646 family protein [Vibrio mimicus]